MKKIRKILVGVLAFLCIGVSVAGIAACDGVTVNPTSDGGIAVTPGVSVDSEKNESSSSEETIKERLATPVITQSNDKGEIFWNFVEGAEAYELIIDPNGAKEIVGGDITCISLEKYFLGNESLQIRIRAVAPSDSDCVNSEYSVYTYVISNETKEGIKGVGYAVNLLTGSYTEFASGTTLIFDKTMLDRIERKKVTSERETQTTSTYVEGLDNYLKQIALNYGSKINTSGSVGYANMKVTAGFGFEVSGNYGKKTYNETTAIFYDLEYCHVRDQMELDGYTDTSKFSDILSAEFLANATKVNNGTMTAEQFVSLYGTHIMTAAIYGATLNAHYELLAGKDEVENTFGMDAKSSIDAGFEANLGVEVEANVSAEKNVGMSYFKSNASEDKQIVFKAHTNGGEVLGAFSSMEELAAAFNENEGINGWIKSITDDNCAIIDVPDGSLYFVWDYLDDTYTNAKNILNEYFLSMCDENYYALKDKMGSMYSESMLFDEEREILTIDFSGLQTYASASLAGVDHASWFNADDGVFKVYSQWEGHPIKKVVFKGSYLQRDSLGQKIENKFDNLAIVFDQGWYTDIVLELDSFAYDAKAGCSAIDFSAVESENITINVVGNVYLKGSNGVLAGTNGFIAVNAVGKNLTINGDESSTLEIRGGNGAQGASYVAWDDTADSKDGGNGGNGATAIFVDELTVGVGVSVKLYGGNGGNGGNGLDGVNGESGVDKTGKGKGTAGGDATINGTNGGDGGKGEYAIVLTSQLNVYGNLTLQGGNGGNGGVGGKGGDGGKGGNSGYYDVTTFIASTYHVPYNGANGGAGSNGGNGGDGNIGKKAIENEAKINIAVDGNCLQVAGVMGGGGAGGNGGNGGAGGDSGTKQAYKAAGNDWYWVGDENIGYGGAGGKGGNGGNGGNGRVVGAAGLAGNGGLAGYQTGNKPQKSLEMVLTPDKNGANGENGEAGSVIAE